MSTLKATRNLSWHMCGNLKTDRDSKSFCAISCRRRNFSVRNLFPDKMFKKMRPFASAYALLLDLTLVTGKSHLLGKGHCDSRLIFLTMNGFCTISFLSVLNST